MATRHSIRCTQCGTAFNASPSDERKFCSQPCYWATLKAAGWRPPNYRHGLADSETHTIWMGMLRRCRPGGHSAKNYGDRGIRVCDRWHVFENFLEDMGLRPSRKHSLDRIDVNGNYEPGNVRWATASTQGRNRRNNRILEFRGRKQPLIDWAEEIGLASALISTRLRAGWAVDRALSTPAQAPMTVMYDGEEMTIAQLAAKAGIRPATLGTRLRRGWTLERATRGVLYPDGFRNQFSEPLEPGSDDVPLTGRPKLGVREALIVQPKEAK